MTITFCDYLGVAASACANETIGQTAVNTTIPNAIHSDKLLGFVL
jgi:hypothetical protein